MVQYDAEFCGQLQVKHPHIRIPPSCELLKYSIQLVLILQ